jgi:hypothetical protein
MKTYQIERAPGGFLCWVVMRGKAYPLVHAVFEQGLLFRDDRIGRGDLALSILADRFAESAEDVHLGIRWLACPWCNGVEERQGDCTVCCAEGGWWFPTRARSRYRVFQIDLLSKISSKGLNLTTIDIDRWWAKKVLAITEDRANKKVVGA